MTKCYSTIFAALLLLSSLAFGQLVTVPQSPTNPQPLSGGFYFAALYNYGGNKPFAPDGLKVDVGNTTTGSSTIIVRPNAFITTLNGDTYMPFAQNAPITIGTNANVETVTPTAVSCNTPAVANSCTITASFSNLHGVGEPISSGTFGLQEAINRAFGNAGNGPGNGNTGVVITDQSWRLAGGLTSTITAASCYFNVVVEDHSSTLGGFQPYACRPTNATSLASGSAPVDAAATGGSMTTGTHRLKYVYVDQAGQYGQPSSELADASSRTGLLVTAPAASAGAVCWIPYVTANGGATKTEIQVPVTSSVCTLSKLAPIPCCSVANTTFGQTGANATILADPSGTPKIFGNSSLTFANDTGYNTSSTVYGYVPVPASTEHQPFSPVYYALATAAASNSTYEVASWNLPANFFNVLGKRWYVRGSFHATSAANSETLTLNLRYGPYQNSDTVLIPLVTSAYSSTNVVDGKFEIEITTAATGATGTLNVHGQLVTNLAGTAALTWFTEATAANAATGVIASLPLTTNNQLTLEAVVGTGAFGSAITFDSITLEPAN